MEINPLLKKKFSFASNEIKSFLPKLSEIDDKNAEKIIKRYVAAIEGNFVPWMGAASVTARSLQGKFAAEENLFVEMKDDHPGMLRSFAKSAKAEPQLEDYDYVYTEVNKIRKMVSEMSGLKNLALMATLENTSEVFIPFIEELAKKLKSKNLIYTEMHGVADIKHANQFIWALEHEMKHHQNPEKLIDQVISETLNLIKKIFLV